MSTRMLVTECFDGNHAACKGYNGPAVAPNFRCDCDCHQTVSDKDNDRRGVLKIINAQILASHKLNADPSNFVINQNSLADALTEYVATVRREAKEEAFKIICSECATGDVPTFNSDLRWYYHFTGSEPFGCSASKLRIAALDRAADSGEGENDG